MISSPQGDLKHTGHVGLDGAYFGDISFLGGKYPHLPRQVVTPYKPQEDATDNNSSQDVIVRNRDGRQHVQHDTQSKHGEYFVYTDSFAIYALRLSLLAYIDEFYQRNILTA